MDNYKEKVKEKVREELNTDYAKENIQILVTVGQILGGIMVTIAFLTFDATLEDNYWIAAGALFLTILLPSSSKLKTLCSSEFLRQFGFYIFTGSVGITIAFLSVLISGISESLSKLPIGIWIYLASGLLLFYEYNRVEKSELKKSFRFVATGLFILSVGSEIIIISHIWNLATSLVQFILVVVKII